VTVRTGVAVYVVDVAVVRDDNGACWLTGVGGAERLAGRLPAGRYHALVAQGPVSGGARLVRTSDACELPVALAWDGRPMGPLAECHKVPAIGDTDD
jgi:hypothetical protein